jgi:hypothetical protein
LTQSAELNPDVHDKTTPNRLSSGGSDQQAEGVCRYSSTMSHEMQRVVVAASGLVDLTGRPDRPT